MAPSASASLVPPCLPADAPRESEFAGQDTWQLYHEGMESLAKEQLCPCFLLYADSFTMIFHAYVLAACCAGSCNASVETVALSI